MGSWFKIDKFGESPLETPFLLMDESGFVYVGTTSIDYYDAMYWSPMPNFPLDYDGVITDDGWISRCFL